MILTTLQVFKYANKGYGIRFLPNYIDALKTIDPSSLPLEAPVPDGSDSDIPNPPSRLSLEEKVAKARDYFERIFQTYMQWTDGGRKLQRHYAGRWSGWRQKEIWVGTTLDSPLTTPGGKAIGTNGVKRDGEDRKASRDETHGVPIFTHALLDTRYQATSEPLRRSALTGFELFYRHVALWEAEQQERLYIQDDVWASLTVSIFR